MEARRKTQELAINPKRKISGPLTITSAKVPSKFECAWEMKYSM